MTGQKIKNFYGVYFWECNIFLISLSLQLLFFVLLILIKGADGFAMMASADSDEYIKLGLSLYNNHSFSLISMGDFSFPETARPPLYPFFLAFFYALCNKFWLAVLAQNLLVALTPVMVYRMGLLLWKMKNIALLGAILYAIEPERLVMGSQILSDSFFVLLFILSLYFYIKAEDDLGEKKNIFFAAIFLFLATLIRPTGLIVLAVFAFFILVRGLKDHLWKKRMAMIFIFFAVVFAGLLPWSIRNLRTTGFFGISSEGGYLLFIENLSFYKEYKLGYHGSREGTSSISVQLMDKFKQDNQIDSSIGGNLLVRGIMRQPKYEDYYLKEFFGAIKEDPLFYAKIHAYRLFPYFTDTKYGLIATKLFHFPAKWGYPYIFFGSRIIWLFIETVVAVGFLLQFIKRGLKIFNLKIVLMLFFIVLFAGASAVNTATSRLRMPINPFIFLFFSYFFYSFLTFLKNYKKRKNIG